jgi:leucyl aminopeptidase (aminopeptidase T)
MPGMTADTFVRTLPADYEQLRQVGQALAQRLTAACSCHVTGPGGTDVLLSLEGRISH